jgi:hypothetical protein
MYGHTFPAPPRRTAATPRRTTAAAEWFGSERLAGRAWIDAAPGNLDRRGGRPESLKLRSNHVQGAAEARLNEQGKLHPARDQGMIAAGSMKAEQDGATGVDFPGIPPQSTDGRERFNADFAFPPAGRIAIVGIVAVMIIADGEITPVKSQRGLALVPTLRGLSDLGLTCL